MRLSCVTVCALAWLAALTGPLLALSLAMPGNGSKTREVALNPDSYHVPIGPWWDGIIPGIEVKGAVTIQTWRLPNESMTTLGIMGSLSDQLSEAGYQTLLHCAGRDCGGFDFRFGTRVLPAPDMFVDLFDYRFLSTRAGTGEGDQYVTILVSRSGNAAYVQVIHADPTGATTLTVDPDGTTRPVVQSEGGGTAPLQPGTNLRLDEALITYGHTVLGDLDFGSGAAALGPGPFSSLDTLAAFLRADPTRRVALVGHTDATGSLDANIALSRKRARAVLERLVGEYDIPRAQLDAEGMGYLSPIAPNLTAEGREANRRVEAVLLNTE